MSTHTKLNASSSKRWFECPGSVKLIAAGGAHDEDSEFAAEGTNAHTLAAMCLEIKTDAWEHIGEKIVPDDAFPEAFFIVTDNMADAVQVYLDYVRGLPEGEGFIETRVDDPTLHPEFGGTADYYKLCGATLHVIDYKHGEGIAVDAEDNTQLMYYAFGVLRRHPEVLNVKMTIVQPRAHHEEGPIRTFALTAEQLHRWAEAKLLPAMLATDAPDAPLNPGEWCRFCPAKLYCPKLVGDTMKLWNAGAVTDKPISGVSDAVLADYRETAKHVRMFLKEVDSEVYRRLFNGGKIPGAILVQKKSDRVWGTTAEKLARERWGDEAFTAPVLLSPKQLEDKLPGGKPFAAEHAFKPDTGLTVADDNGSRIAAKRPTMAETFKNIIKAPIPAAEEETY